MVEQKEIQKELSPEKFEEAVIQATLYSFNDDDKEIEKLLGSLTNNDLDSLLYYHASWIKTIVEEKIGREAHG